MAHREDIDRVRESVDLVELVSEVTTVKRSGRSFMAVCPFHQEKTPSMSLDRGRGLYHCFGCGKGGDVFTFVAETQGIDFRESLEMLARRAGVALSEDPSQTRDRGRRAEAVEAIRRAVDVYHQRLKSSGEAGPARAYLRHRGYDLEVIEEWRLGFAGTDWDTLTRELKGAGLPDRTLTDAGLSRKGRHGLYDVFRGRLMFPIYDLRGDAVGFGGRKVDGIDPTATSNPEAKYVNSADSVVYQKGRLLYGLDRARRHIGDDSPAVVVEGYTDVIAMQLAGVPTAVATCGTALGEGHFDLLRRFGERIVLAFDADEAGSRAALRGDELEMPFRLDLDLRVAEMPDGLDPADLVQQGRGGELAKAVATARPLLERRIEHEVGRHDVSTPEGKARALRAAAGHLSRVPDSIVRDEYARLLARRVGVELDLVHRALRGRDVSSSLVTDSGRPLDRFEAEVLRAAIEDPGLLAELDGGDFEDERLRRGFEAVLALSQSGSTDLASVPEPDSRSLLMSLALDTTPPPAVGEMLERIRERRLESEIDRLEAELAALEEGSQAHTAGLQRLIALHREKRSTTHT